MATMDKKVKRKRNNSNALLLFLFVRFFPTELLPTLRTECLTLALYSFFTFESRFLRESLKKTKMNSKKKSPPLITLFFSLAPFLPLLPYSLSAASRLFLFLLLAPVLQTRVQQGFRRVLEHRKRAPLVTDRKRAPLVTNRGGGKRARKLGRAGGDTRNGTKTKTHL